MILYYFLQINKIVKFITLVLDARMLPNRQRYRTLLLPFKIQTLLPQWISQVRTWIKRHIPDFPLCTWKWRLCTTMLNRVRANAYMCTSWKDFNRISMLKSCNVCQKKDWKNYKPGNCISQSRHLLSRTDDVMTQLCPQSSKSQCHKNIMSHVYRIYIIQ